MEKYLFLTLIFAVFYILFVVFVRIDIKEYPEIIVGSVFFFTFFSGFFIARQSDRFSRVQEVIASTDGMFSYLYRISGLVPRIQGETREIIREHYKKIEESNNWAYHILNPSITITNLTKTFGKVTPEEASSPVVAQAFQVIWIALSQLQELRKKMIILYHQKLLLFQWIIIYILAGLFVFSFNLLPSNSFLVDFLKVVFGITVFLCIILLKQLNDLAIFGKDFAKRTARDIFRILDEKDIEEIKKFLTGRD